MRLILVTGGARSGKSAYAQRRAAALGGDSVTVIVTARPADEEMARRIARHRAGRPATWRTIEAPWDAGAALKSVETQVALLDCITLLAANAVLDSRAASEEQAVAAVAEEVEHLLSARAGKRGSLIVVTNEVGLGIVPDSTMGRWFRDALGLANQRLTAAADEAVMLVSGVPIPLKG